MPDNRCVRISDLKRKIKYHPEVGTYVSEEDIDLAERVFCGCAEATKVSEGGLNYMQAYNNGVMAFAEYLKEHSCFYDLDNYHSFQAVDVDYLNDMVAEFLKSRQQ